MEQLDFDSLLVDEDFCFLENGLLLDVDAPVLSDSPPTENFSNSSPESVSSWFGQIESLLMKDDDQDHQIGSDPEGLTNTDFLADILVDFPVDDPGSVDKESDGSRIGSPEKAIEADFLADMLVDSPANDSGSVEKESDGSRIGSPEKEIADVPTEKEFGDVSDGSGKGNPEKEIADVPMEKKFGNLSDDSGNESPEKGSADRKEVNKDCDDTDNPASKKIKRQLRNRDAAVRSRERKKMYVKDLETKSRYLERECMRLGRMLQCFVAENQALRLSLQKGGNPYGASMSKQESAVLFWESLLLVSLLWFLGIMCLFPQPPLEPIQTETVTKNGQEDEAVREGGNKTTTYTRCLLMGRRCIGSKTRMKTQPSWTFCSDIRNPCVF